MSSRAGDESELGLDRTIRVFNLFGLNGEMVHSGCEAAEEGFEGAYSGSFFSITSNGCGCGIGQLGALVERHPIEEPGVGFVLDVDFNINEQTSFEEVCAMPDTFLGNREHSSKAC